jgi:glycosyltransferase involved in cell wall biosynthesis
MKIAFIYDAIYPYIKGGAELRIWELSKRLTERGHEVHLFGMKFWDGNEVIKRDGFFLHGVCKAKKLYTQEGKRSITQALYFSLKLLNPLMKGEEDYDVINCEAFPYFPCFTAKFYSLMRGRKPFVITWHEVWRDYWYHYLGRKKGIIGIIVEKLTSKLTKSNIAVSNLTKKKLLKIGVEEKDIQVIENGIDLEKIKKVKPLSHEEKKFDIIFFGRLIKEKNLDVLIKAIFQLRKKIPNVKVAIIGEGPERKKLENLAKKLKLRKNIKFLGFFENQEDVFSIMKSSKIFVLPSTREGFGIVALEANACGLPVITPEHEMNASSELIKNGRNGFKGKLSEKFLVEKIIFLLENEHLRKKMSEEAKKFSQDYSWEKISEKLENYYSKIIAK